ncbi:hypothetical protein NDU88_001671 [Pleurodeles waltl]|uniref:Uncharacterized protein n=1 Tax=Pleurodeles waltl TaxID=8319 RepID=A0AAV7U957_PLEWA|nr:hypothetical protein NDU88_001671 [Pleurodeles waltl]
MLQNGESGADATGTTWFKGGAQHNTPKKQLTAIFELPPALMTLQDCISLCEQRHGYIVKAVYFGWSEGAAKKPRLQSQGASKELRLQQHRRPPASQWITSRPDKPAISPPTRVSSSCDRLRGAQDTRKKDEGKR